MTYKFLNTIIDDLFAFVIKMPTMHRLSVFRCVALWLESLGEHCESVAGLLFSFPFLFFSTARALHALTSGVRTCAALFPREGGHTHMDGGGHTLA